ncbi:MAG TPA: hypothetical protein VE325_11475 [Burkholderiales bacterium]|nr:hypothetical protein [Burkholderiales bacterium]
MKETLYTETLARAAQAEGGSAALASMLRVPEKTLERWMSGRAQTPVRAFIKVLERLAAHEASGVAPPLAPVNGEPLSFTLGPLAARCTRCDSTEFAPADPARPYNLLSELVCRACGEQVVHSNLLAQLAQDAVLHSRANTAARHRRLAGRTKPEVPR